MIPNKNEMQAEVLKRIRSGELRMRPRFFFLLKTALVVLIAALILLLSVWLASFISFGLRLNGHESLLGFGAQGPITFLIIFPWSLAIVDLILIGLLGWLLRRFKFGYRRPFVYLMVALLLIGALTGLLFDRETSFHDDRFEEAEAGELFGLFENLYESAASIAPEEHGIFRGFVLEVGRESFVLTHDDHDRDEDDGAWAVLPPAGFDMQTVRVGDRVYVAGERENGVIEAYGVRILER